MTAKRWRRWVIPAVLLAAVVALNIAGLTVRSAQQSRDRVSGLTVIQPPEDVSAVAMWNGTVYAGGQAGLFSIDTEEGQAHPESFDGQLEPAHVRALLAEDDTLWIGQETGLVRVDESGVSVLGTADGLPSERVRCLLRDSQGRVWAGTTGGAALIENGQVTNVLTQAHGLADDVVNAMAQDAEERIWFGSYDAPTGGVSVTVAGDGEGFSRFTVAEGLPHPSVTCILPEADGTVWVGTGFHDRGGLARFDASAGKGVSIAQTYLQPDGLAGPKVRSLYRSDGGVLWVASERDGIALWPPAPDVGVEPTIVTVQSGLSDNEVKCFLPLGGDRLLLGTRNGITIVEDVAQFERDALGASK